MSPSRFALFACCMVTSCSSHSEPRSPQSITEPEPPSLPSTAPADTPSPSEEAPPLSPLERLEQLGPDASTSLGTPTSGSVSPSVALPLEGPGFRFSPLKDPQNRHGTIEMVTAVARAAGAVHQERPGGTVTFGDLSAPNGGDIQGHASHRSGRDIDVYFFLLDEDGNPRPGKAIPIEPTGWGADYRDLSIGEDDIAVQLDVPRTWAFVAALVTDPKAAINRIFIAEHLRALLLEEADRVDAAPQAIERFGAITCQPRFPHDDHMHIRFYCPPDDIVEGCEDTLPFYPWHLDALTKLGVKPKLARRDRKKATQLKSHKAAEEQAKTEYGEFHPDVEAFLARRRQWVKKPHPGRPYCK